MQSLTYEEWDEWRKQKQRELLLYATQRQVPRKRAKKILKSISTLLLNIVNEMDVQEACEEAASFICVKEPLLNREDVYSILSQRESMQKEQFPKFRRRLRRTGFILSPEKYIWFSRFTEMDIRSLDLRYGFIQPTSHFFWSIHPEFYAALASEDPIEGFASPFNFNAKRWCSRFEEDKVFGSLGNFFTVIKEHRSEYTLWILNAPYTFYIFNLLLEVVKWRRDHFPKDEYIFLLPEWDMPIYDYIRQEGSHVKLKGGTYRIYDYSLSEDIAPPTDMAMGYIGNKSHFWDALEYIRIPKLRGSDNTF